MEMDPFFAVSDAKAASSSKSVAATLTPVAAQLPHSSPPVFTSNTNIGAHPPDITTASIGVSEKKSAAPSMAPSHKTVGIVAESKSQPVLDEANEEIALLLESGKVTMREVSALQNMMRDHVALRDKVSKLKSLLGRSAKAQREAKMELETTQKRLDQALKEVEKLALKVERLQTRPTHMDLLADFETNFDRALLTVGQAGGQEASEHQHQSQQTAVAAPSHAILNDESAVVDGMLMQELSESKHRAERIEQLNSALLHRSTQLEQEAKSYQKERDMANERLHRVQLELKMAQMEADHANRAVQDKMASLSEMQLEIDLVTRASVDANVRAAQGEQAAKSVMTDKQHVQQLELQVQALQEWALASADAKRSSQDRVEFLEEQVQMYKNERKEKSLAASGQSRNKRSLFQKASSIVVGAGDIGFTVMELQAEAAVLQDNERVLLRWKFDITPSDMSVDFNILKGKCDSAVIQKRADYLIQTRVVTGGAGGETETAFAIQNACTLLWSNKKSWVRPRTVKYEVEALAVHD